MTKHISADRVRHLVEQDAHFSPDCRFVVFVGFGHSGHSLLGGLLDAHPFAAIANELNVLRQLRDHDLDFEQLRRLIVACSFENERSGGWTNTGYQYRVQGGEQGRADHLAVVGDKKGGGTARLIQSDPDLWKSLVNMAGDRLRVISVVRHPLDMLAAAAYRREILPDMASADRIALNAGALSVARASVPESHFYCVKHEDFLDNPGNHLKTLCQFLGLDLPASYLDACLELVRPTVHERRLSIAWPDGLPEYLEHALRQSEAADLFASYMPLIGKGKTT